jgi:DNA-binding HxlR family transcriptional regulator
MNSRTVRKNDKKQVGCPVETTLEAIGGRWKVLVIHHLLEGTKRFGELRLLLDGISARTLTRQLRELEESGIIDRYDHRQIPPKVDYSLTPVGKKLSPILHAMHDWGVEAERRRARTNK